MADSIQDKINQQAIVSKNDMLWGKSTHDILNGRMAEICRLELSLSVPLVVYETKTINHYG